MVYAHVYVSMVEGHDKYSKLTLTEEVLIQLNGHMVYSTLGDRVEESI